LGGWGGGGGGGKKSRVAVVHSDRRGEKREEKKNWFARASSVPNKEWGKVGRMGARKQPGVSKKRKRARRGGKDAPTSAAGKRKGKKS